MNDVAELLHLEEMIDVYRLWLAHAVDVVSRKVDQHDMFCAVLLRVEQFCS